MKTWLKFNGVGIIGAGVQLAALAVLKYGLRIHYLVATVMAVEFTVLHNFVWHERWTWADRTKLIPASISRRLLCFHLANGLISICGNFVMMWLLVSRLQLNYLAANVLSIAACSLLNFCASDRFVFRVRL